MRTVFVTDGSETAFYAAVFSGWNKNAYLTSKQNFQPALTDELADVSGIDAQSETKAARVKAALQKIDARALHEIGRILLSGNDEKEQTAFLYLKEIFRCKAPARDKTYLPVVAAATDLYRQIGKELERLKGFLRFKETAAGVYYAACAPDNDILPLLAPHFIRRLQLPFILHDISRGYALCYNGERTVKLRAARAEIPLSEREEKISALWKQYFNTVAIRARANAKLQDTLMPRRYRKFMDETAPTPPADKPDRKE